MVALPDSADTAHPKILSVLCTFLPDEQAYVALECLAAYGGRKQRRAQFFETRASQLFNIVSLGPQPKSKSSSGSQHWRVLAASVHHHNPDARTPNVARTERFLNLLSSPHTTFPQTITNISLTEHRKSTAGSLSKWIPAAIHPLLKLSRVHTLEMRGWDWRTLGRTSATTLTPIWARLTTLIISGDVYFETFFILTDILSRCTQLVDLTISGNMTWVDSWYPDASRSPAVPLNSVQRLKLGGAWEKHTFLEWFCSFDRGDHASVVNFSIENVGEEDVIPVLTYLHMYGAGLEVLVVEFTATDINAHDEFIEMADLGLLTRIVSLQILKVHSGCIAYLFSKFLIQIVSPDLHTLQLDFADDPNVLRFVLDEVVQWGQVDSFFGGVLTIAEDEDGKGKRKENEQVHGPDSSEFRFPHLAVVDIALSPFGIGRKEQKDQVGYAEVIDNPTLPQRLPLCASRNVYCGPVPEEVPEYVEDVDDSEEEAVQFLKIEEEFDDFGLPIYRPGGGDFEH